MESVKSKIDELRVQIKRANTEYYALDQPRISDAEYDNLMRELERLEAEHPEFLTSDSPSQTVGAKTLAVDTLGPTFSAVQHREPMMSLANALDEGEFREFHARVLKALGETQVEYVVEYKFDGTAIELVYRRGELYSAATRGDGEVGENVSENARTIANIPKQLSFDALALPEQLEIRGEIILSKQAFLRLNEDRAVKGEAQFANARNAAAGSLRQLDAKVTASRNLEFYAYSIGSPQWTGAESVEAGASPFSTHAEELKVLSKLGFAVPAEVLQTSSPEELIEFFSQLKERRESLPFEIDGLVVKVNELKKQALLGVRSRSPRWAVALKFPPQEAYTVIEHITVQVGRTGVLTPVAELRPVQIGGVLVKRATLHNQDEIDRKDIRLGDTVVVRRQGDVIPAVVAVVTAKRTGEEQKFHLPANCPICDTEVRREAEQDTAVRCPNPACPAKLINRLKHFVSRKALNMDSLGPKLLEQLVDKGLINSSADLFTLRYEQLLELDRMGEKSARKIISEIEKAKDVSLSRFLYALGIRHVGEQTAESLAEHFRSLEAVSNATLSELEAVSDVGPKVSQTIFAFFNSPEEQENIRKMLDNALSPRVVEELKVELGGKFKGELVVITGSLSSLSRQDAQEKIKAEGGAVSDSVGKKTTLLVVGKEAGSKLEKARELGIPTIDEVQFLARLGL